MKTISIIRDGKTIHLSKEEAFSIAEVVREEQARLLIDHLIDGEDDEDFVSLYGVDKTFITGNEEIMQDIASELACTTDGLLHDRDEAVWDYLDNKIKEYV